MRISNGIEELIGATPLVALHRFSAEQGLSTPLVVKLEKNNPGGSSKDRIARQILLEAIEEGRLREGGTVIEPTSGNTGIGLAMLCAVRGYRCIIVMPDNMSIERQKLMTAYGAELVLTPGAEGMTGAIRKAEELNAEIENSIIGGQFTNEANPRAHYLTTGREIWEDTDGTLDAFVAGIGTGGTVSGAAKYLKEQKPDIRIIGVEPTKSNVISGGKAGAHGLQGIGAGFIPQTLDLNVIDEMLCINEEEAYAAARALARTEGILVGISSGAALAAAIKWARQNTDRQIVVLLADSGERYLSGDLF